MKLNLHIPALFAALLTLVGGQRVAALDYSNAYSITTLAGNVGNSGNLINGLGTAASFSNPNAVAVDSSGNVYVADTLDYCVRMITPAGNVTTLAGSGSMGEVDGPGTGAKFGPLKGIAVDSSGNVYVTDWVSNGGGAGGSLRKISAGTVSTVLNGTLNSPEGLTFDSAGNLYIADAGNGVIRKLASGSSSPSIYAGTLGHTGFNDGPIGTGQLGFAVGLAFDPSGILYVTDEAGSNIRKVAADGTLSTYNSGVAPASPGPPLVDGPIVSAVFSHPTGLGADSAGNLFLVDGGTVIREITASGNVTTLAGSLGASGSLNSSGINAHFNGAIGLAATSNSVIFIADAGNGLIRQGNAMASQTPTIQFQPVTQTVNNGGSVTVMATVNGSNLTYQWYLNNVAIPGANSNTLTVGAIGSNQAGNYTVTASNSFGSVTSNPAVVTVSTKAQIVNLSTLDTAGSGSSVLAAGFSLSGLSTTTKTILIRGIGPTLSVFGVPNPLANPQLGLYNSSSTLIASNVGWNNDPTLAAAFTATGAFALPAGSADSALLATLAPSTYTAQVTGAGNTTGPALVEIYDDSVSNANATLVNISSRANVTPAAPLTVGFVLSGTTSTTLVIRGIGPALSAFGITNPLPAPTLKIFDVNGNLINSNTGWGSTSALATAFLKVGAFTLPTGSADSALIVSLAPGNYTAQISSSDGNSGVGLVELFFMP
jgi:sugar lactone lactonase YvrE